MYDNAFEALANESRRRLLLDLLESNPQEVRVESRTDAESAPTEAEKRWQTAMHHTHLPKLADVGFIQWHEDTQEAVKGPRFQDVRPLLELIADDDAVVDHKN